MPALHQALHGTRHVSLPLPLKFHRYLGLEHRIARGSNQHAAAAIWEAFFSGGMHRNAPLRWLTAQGSICPLSAIIIGRFASLRPGSLLCALFNSVFMLSFVLNKCSAPHRFKQVMKTRKHR